MSARTILKHLHQQGRMTDYQFDVINRNLRERPHGEWIVDEDAFPKDFRKCSICNEDAEWLEGGCQFLPNFCPNCGAEMRKEAENEI